MTTTLELIRGATTLDISDETTYIHEAHEGFGMPPVHNIVERAPLQHGETYRDFRLDPRIVQLVVPLTPDAAGEAAYTARAALLEVLKPGSSPVYLKYTLPDASVRQLECRLEAGPSFATGDMWGGEQFWKAGFSLVAYDPTWYDPVGESVTFQLGGGTAGVVPSIVPTIVGASTIDQLQAVTYAGTWRAYPHIIRITGPITDAVVTNETTGEKLDFTGTTIAGGTYYDIDLRFGYKTVVNNSGTNVLSALTADSDLATFHLEADPDAAGGSNSIRVEGSSVTASTKVEMNYFVRYLGI